MRRQALNAIRGRGTIVAMFLLLLFSMLIGWLIGGPDRDTASFGNVDWDAERNCHALYSALLLSRDRCVYDPDCLSIANGADEPAFPSGVLGVAQAVESGREVNSALATVHGSATLLLFGALPTQLR